jgi:predicted RNA-binding protein with PUA-like domain
MAKAKSGHKNYWLMKSEPNEYSIDDLKKDKATLWDGVRNYQVRNMMRDEMKVGDLVLFYHSNTNEIGVVGEMEIVKEAYPDPMQFDKKDKHYDPKSKPEDPRWLCVDVKFRSKFPRTVTLGEMRLEGELKDMKILQKGNRLSVTPVNKREYDYVVKLANN